MLVANALRWIGTPYAYGTDGPATMDCSGFVHRVVVESGSLPLAEAPRRSADFRSVGKPVEGEIEPGDILLFSYRGRVDHVAIALSSDAFINAISRGPRRGVVISSLSDECWKDSFAGARRIGRR
ncbi:MAG: NlpC/P60 family protein [Treponema sp.]|nr:NlpC/P60 family protein [Treponema sp.]